jgi:hypothetical protein
MRVHLICFVYLVVSYGIAQTHNGKVVPKITTLPIEDGEVTVLHLVVIGNPASFKAEHSENEARLVFLRMDEQNVTSGSWAYLHRWCQERRVRFLLRAFILRV